MGNSRKGDIPMDLPTRILAPRATIPPGQEWRPSAPHSEKGRAVIWSLPGLALIVDRPITPGAVVALIRSHKAASRTSDK